ncbi:guanylate kinase, partial [Hungatella sp. SL.1.14]|nr:guanylate kinase [Hungatella sp. SL.1.14]
VNHYYGTPNEYVLNHMEQGKDVLLEIESQGALKVKERFPEAILIFVMPPSAEELKRRLVGRGTESMEVIHARLRRAVEEAEGMDSYDYILINDDIAS